MMIRAAAVSIMGLTLAACAEFGGALGDVRVQQIRELIDSQLGWVVPDDEARRAAKFPENIRIAANLVTGPDAAIWVLCDYDTPGYVFTSVTSPHLARTLPAAREITLSLNGEDAIADRVERATYTLRSAHNEAWFREISTSNVSSLEAEGQLIGLVRIDLEGTINSVVDDCRRQWKLVDRTRRPA